MSYRIEWTETRGPASCAESTTDYRPQTPGEPALWWCSYAEAAQCARDGFAMLDVMRYPVAVDWTIYEGREIVTLGRWYPFAR